MAVAEMINQDFHRFTVIHPLDGVIWGVNVYIHVSCSITVDKFRRMISAMATPAQPRSHHRDRSRGTERCMVLGRPGPQFDTKKIH